MDQLGASDLEARIVALELEYIWVVNSYAPATGDEVRQKKRIDEWNPMFGLYLENLYKSGKGVVLCGDLNIATRPGDNTIPASESPPWMKPGDYPCSTDAERESWQRDVVKDWLFDTFRYLYPRAENVVSWTPTILHRV